MFNTAQFLLDSLAVLLPSTWLAILGIIIIFNLISIPFLYYAFKQKRRIKSKILFFIVNKSTLNLLIQKIWFNNFVFINFLNYLKINDILFNLKLKFNFLKYLIFNFHQIFLVHQLQSCKKYFRHRIVF